MENEQVSTMPATVEKYWEKMSARAYLSKGGA